MEDGGSSVLSAGGRHWFIAYFQVDCLRDVCFKFIIKCEVYGTPSDVC